MAKQKSLLKFRGKIGDLSFTRHRSRGYGARMPGGADKQRIMDIGILCLLCGIPYRLHA